MVEVTKTKMRKWARGKEKGTWALAMAAGCNLAESSQVRIPGDSPVSGEIKVASLQGLQQSWRHEEQCITLGLCFYTVR